MASSNEGTGRPASLYAAVSLTTLVWMISTSWRSISAMVGIRRTDTHVFGLFKYASCPVAGFYRQRGVSVAR